MCKNAATADVVVQKILNFLLFGEDESALYQCLLYYIALQLCFKMDATLAHIENDETDHNIVYSM